MCVLDIAPARALPPHRRRITRPHFIKWKRTKNKVIPSCHRTPYPAHLPQLACTPWQLVITLLLGDQRRSVRGDTLRTLQRAVRSRHLPHGVALQRRVRRGIEVEFLAKLPVCVGGSVCVEGSNLPHGVALQPRIRRGIPGEAHSLRGRIEEVAGTHVVVVHLARAVEVARPPLRLSHQAQEA